MLKQTVVVNENLKELRASGYEMVKGEPDIRGWKIIDSRNVVIGKIKELLFDVASKKVRYLIVDLDGKPLNLLSRDIIVPVGLAELDATENVVYFPDVTVGHLASLPEYKKGKLTYHVEREIRDVFIPQNSGAADKLADFEAKDSPEREAFYNNTYFDENRLYKRRRMEEKLKDKTYEDERNTEEHTRYVPATDLRETDNIRNEENVIYIPDEHDPSVLRRAKVVKEGPRN
jgi:hypothetical protein